MSFHKTFHFGPFSASFSSGAFEIQTPMQAKDSLDTKAIVQQAEQHCGACTKALEGHDAKAAQESLAKAIECCAEAMDRLMAP